MDREDETIRQTEVNNPSKQVPAWIQWANGSKETNPVVVGIDPLGRVHVDLKSIKNGRRKTSVRAVSFDKERSEWSRATKTDLRYEGDEPTTLVVSFGEE